MRERKWNCMLTEVVDFALTEAAYTIVRVLQRFPDIRLRVGEKVEPLGVEKQKMTLVLSIADGCKFNFDHNL